MLFVHDRARIPPGPTTSSHPHDCVDLFRRRGAPEGPTQQRRQPRPPRSESTWKTPGQATTVAWVQASSGRILQTSSSLTSQTDTPNRRVPGLSSGFHWAALQLACWQLASRACSTALPSVTAFSPGHATTIRGKRAVRSQTRSGPSQACSGRPWVRRWNSTNHLMSADARLKR